MSLRKFLVLFLLSSSVSLMAQNPFQPDSTLGRRNFVEDDPVASMLDSLAGLKVFENSEYFKKGAFGANTVYNSDNIPYFPDSVYRDRITEMSLQSPFEYTYNADVRQFIDLYAFKKRGLTSRILGLSQIYFPLFEEQLDKYNMPLELKYLAVIESALNPVANSRAGAKGLWQFMYGTGKVYGLKISSYTDDRFDPVKSTIAACEHLSDLFAIYDNWSLALAAYNSGPGNVNKAIRRAGGAKDFWVIQKFLPKETRSYVPAFIAASYVMTYSTEHKIFPVDPGILFYEIDTVTVRNPLTFDQLSEMLHIPYEELQFLNPSFKQGVIPGTSETPYKLRLRKKYIGDFINNETSLYAYRTKSGIAKDSLMALALSNNRETIEYRVRKGESITTIARKFHMSVSDLKSLNGLKKNYVKPKQRLLVYSGTAKQPFPETLSLANKPAPDPVTKPEIEPRNEVPETPVYHTVRAGENLGRIAQKYGCSVTNLMNWNNLKSQTILVGQKLKVSSTGKGIASREPEPARTTKTVSPRYIWYTVKQGDNLWEIAEKYDVTVSEIKKLNNITNAQRLRAGKKLKIPKGN